MFLLIVLFLLLSANALNLITLTNTAIFSIIAGIALFIILVFSFTVKVNAKVKGITFRENLTFLFSSLNKIKSRKERRDKLRAEYSKMVDEIIEHLKD